MDFQCKCVKADSEKTVLGSQDDFRECTHDARYQFECSFNSLQSGISLLCTEKPVECFVTKLLPELLRLTCHSPISADSLVEGDNYGGNNPTRGCQWARNYVGMNFMEGKSNSRFFATAVHSQSVVSQSLLRWRNDVVLSRPLHGFFLVFDEPMSSRFLKRLERRHKLVIRVKLLA